MSIFIVSDPVWYKGTVFEGLSQFINFLMLTIIDTANERKRQLELDQTIICMVKKVLSL